MKRSHPCRVPGCGVACIGRFFMCTKHWNRLPQVVKDKMQSARVRHRAEKSEASASALGLAEADAIDYAAGVKGGVA